MEFYFRDKQLFKPRNVFDNNSSNCSSSSVNSTSTDGNYHKSMVIKPKMVKNHHEKLFSNLKQLQEMKEKMEKKLNKSKEIDNLVEYIDALQLKATTVLNRNFITNYSESDDNSLTDFNLSACTESHHKVPDVLHNSSDMIPTKGIMRGKINALDKKPLVVKYKKTVRFPNELVEIKTTIKKSKFKSKTRRKENFSLKSRKNSFDEILSSISSSFDQPTSF